ARAGRREQRCADLRRLCPQARCARQGAGSTAALRSQPPDRGARLRWRPGRRQAADDGRNRRAAGRSCGDHRRQSAQRESRQHSRCYPGGGARRGRDRRSARGNLRIDRGIAPRRRAADRRQGPRNRPNHRQTGAAVQRPRRGRRRARGEGGMSEPLWTLDAMTNAMRAARSGPLPPSISGLSIDSRTIGRGEAFFAIKDNRDGHDFVAAALAAGAGLAVVAADKRDQFSNDAPLLVVPDVLDGLRDLARAARARSPAKIIGVTGSVGKTGTKEALRLALGKDGETHASVASYNNHWGVPLSLPRCRQPALYAVCEMGMTHAGEIEPLTRLVRPHVAIITTVEPVHLEFFGSLEAIADAKAEIFLGIERGGAAVIN